MRRGYPVRPETDLQRMLATLQPSPQGSTAAAPPIAGSRHRQVQQMLQSGHTAKEIAVETGMPLGDVEMAISTIRPS